jgi:hypothetical protein
LTLGTNNQVILKLDHQSNRGPVVELIAIGSIGTNSKLAGVRSWNRVASYSNIEWSNVNMRGNTPSTVWIEISDTGRLIKLINSLKILMETQHDNYCDIQVFINENDWIMRQADTNTSVSLPVRWFDSKWASATITNPSISAPLCCVKLVSGLDQISAILKRVDKWREEWSVDLLSVAVDRGRDTGVWDIKFVAETSTPPHVKLSATLPNCPEQQLSINRPFEPCEVSVSLTAATRALITPLAENDKLSTATSGIALMWIPNEGLACNINWNSLGLGQITTTIFIPCRIIN